MKFAETNLRGVFIVDLERLKDDRGFFARSWCQREFAALGLNAAVAQCNVSYNRAAHTLRGLHFQGAPYEEAKLVRCTSGAIYDVIVDLRPRSETYLKHLGITLAAGDRRAVYVPEGFAHGFLTLADDTEVFYQMSEFYEPSAARGFRFDDPAFGVEWPAPVAVISDRDRSYPDFSSLQPAENLA